MQSNELLFLDDPRLGPLRSYQRHYLVEIARLAPHQGILVSVFYGERPTTNVHNQAVASFHLEKLIPDLHFNDSTLVVNPCNSPEQIPITFGAHM